MSGLTLWIDGDLRSSAKPQVDLLDQAMHYGSGVFEGIRVYDTAHGPAVFRLHEHMARLQRGADCFGFTLDIRAMNESIGTLLRANDFTSAYVRPIAWLGGDGLHLDVGSMSLRQAVAVLPWTSHLGDDASDNGVRMMTSSFRRNSASAMPPLKICGGYVNSLLAKLEAKRSGFDEALFLDGDNVCEATAENVFFVKNGQFVAVEHPDMLPGITRDTLIQLSGATSRPASLAELMDADEIFLCGTSAEVAGVTQLNNRRLPIGPLTRALAHTYQDIVHGRDLSRAAWLTHVGDAATAQVA